ncbi:MAG: adenylate/guanylate cyclase domain-containing protein [Chloroflexota bacterium]|nr:MAG: adenylate/guanylate cyclase domain-containing protein [Chloroflexota bacterium]
MICSNCATENRPDAKFCMECGTPLAAGCPTCGTVNPPGAKFCSECATRLDGGRTAVASGASPGAVPRAGDGRTDPATAERRLVSVLFADLVGFTPFAEEKDAEDVREVLTRYFDIARDVIGRYGGTVEKFIGDAVMAVWGAPIAREDDAERAVRAALELVDAVRVLGPGIQARAGVLTGEAAVTLGATNQGMVAGDMVNTAARLQAAAAPGMVLVGEATQRAAGGVAFEPAGDQVLKGKAAPVPAWRAVRVVGERGGRGRSEALEAQFVGRDEELRQIKDHFHATAREGRARLVSVVGPGGIGKTRLSWELEKYIDGLMVTVWWHAGRSPAYGQGITFWALGEMVRGRARLVETDDEATTRERIGATVREHVTDPTEADWIESALLALLGFESGIPPAQLFAAWRTFFERLAASSPVVMVFEDLHHADNGLLDFIDHLMEWSRGVPLTVITLARPELLDKRPDWGAGKRSFTSIYLEPLPPEEMERLLSGLVPGLPRKAIDAIVGRADGIPLYAVETVRMLLAQERLVLVDGQYVPVGDLDDVAVPETLTALIAARLDGLGPEDRAIVEDAAVLGQSFTIAGLGAVSGIAADELERRLAGLVRRELLVHDLDPRSPERGQYAFVQALIREVAYNTLAKKDRKVRHLAAARFFESLGSDELAGGLAGHYLAAQRLAADEDEATALAAQARLALRGAADRAAALGSHDQAVMFLEQALEVTTDPAERADLHERALHSASQGIEPEVVLRHAEGALRERRSVGDREAIARAAAAHATVLFAFYGDPERARALLDEAWAELSDLEGTPGGVALMVAMVRARRAQNDEAAALEWLERYLPISERLGVLEPTARGIMGRGVVLLNLGRPREGLVLLRGAHAFALANDLHDVEFNARVLMTFYEQWGEPVRGLELGREGFEIGTRRSSRVYGFGMVGNSVICALRVGEWDWAADLLDEWLSIEATAAGWAELFVDRAILRALRGEDPASDIEEAARLRATITDPQFESYDLFARAWAALAAGDLAAARTHAARASEITDYFQPLAMPLEVRATTWSGDLEAAELVVARFEAGGFWGPALQVDRLAARAGLAALRGNGPEALAGFREAVRAYRGLGLAFDEAAAAVDMATLLGAPEREAPDVVAAINGARETLTRLGARPFLAQLDRVAAATGNRAVPGPRRAATVRESVSPGPRPE